MATRTCGQPTCFCTTTPSRNGLFSKTCREFCERLPLFNPNPLAGTGCRMHRISGSASIPEAHKLFAIFSRILLLSAARQGREVQILHRVEIREAFSGRNAGEVGQPDMVPFSSGKVLIQAVLDTRTIAMQARKQAFHDTNPGRQPVHQSDT